jgi:aldehyde dehydrogenase (NAD+)
MTLETIKKSFDMKRDFFDNGWTKSYEFRIEQLKKLKSAIQNNEKEIMEALYLDLHKPEFEAYTSEIGILYEEINEALKHLKSWMKPQKVTTPLVLHPSQSHIYYEPLGIVLIIGPWNYPFQLVLAPLIGAIAAGNCALLKPSDQTPNVSNLVMRMITEIFAEEYISVVQGPGAMVGPMLIDQFRFDHIFFTGSPSVGKEIARMAAAHLTPVTLELGGKSPVIVDQSANLDVAAKRLIWAKFFNAGQTCVCPDYLLVHESVKEAFILKMKETIVDYFGDNPIESDSFGRIVSDRRVEALKKILVSGKIIHGGQVVETQKYIAPTLIDDVSMDDLIMNEEIFGPILPIISYSTLNQALGIIRQNRYPLALYLFTENEANEKYFIDNVEFGGGCINNAMIHLVNTGLPFGGVGNSGTGRYHAKYSFETFSHHKSVVKTGNWLDPSLRYAPYKKAKLELAKRFMK